MLKSGSNQPGPGSPILKSPWKKVVVLIYPFLLAYYPIFALRNHNIVYVDFSTILRTLLLVTAGTAVLMAVAQLLLRNLEKSGILVSLLAILFLSYGHIYIQLENSLGSPVQHRYLAGGALLIFVLAAILVLTKDQVAGALSQILATASFVLLALVLFESVCYDLGVYQAVASAAQKETSDAQVNNDHLPDFYLIILDGHTRSDVLKTRYEFDNSSFIQQLNEMGFYVSACSQSNYASTKFSLTSAVYGDYVQSFAPGGVLPPLETSPLVQTLRSLGYQTITFENRAHGHFDLKEDLRLSRNQMAFGKFDLRGGFGEFEKMMIETSFLRFVEDTELVPGFDQDTLQEWELWEHYYQTQYILSELESIPDMPGPKFVFTHIMVPHAPFIFAPDGSFLRKDSPIDGYRMNSEFIDNVLPPILQTIIKKSDPQPIIVVMGDHGPATRKTISKEMRMATLNAYLVNDTAQEQLYPTTTPINAFRIIQNAHFGASLPLLEDVSYYAYKPEQLDDAEIIPNTCPITDF